jgi:beta-galactosidase
VSDAAVLARYQSNELGAEAAITTKAIGAGRATYVGTVPNPALARSIARWAAPATAHRAWRAPRAVTVASGRGDRDCLVFASNWSNQPAQVTAPVSALDVLSGRRHGPGEAVHLAPRGVRVLRIDDLIEQPSANERRNI